MCFGLCQRLVWIIYRNHTRIPHFWSFEEEFCENFFVLCLACVTPGASTFLQMLYSICFHKIPPTELFGSDLLFGKRKEIMRFNGVLIFYLAQRNNLRSATNSVLPFGCEFCVWTPLSFCSSSRVSSEALFFCRLLERNQVLSK